MADNSRLPPEPAVRSISPAPEDFASRPGVAQWGWPLFWVAAAVGLWLVVRAAGWTPFSA